jgi:2-methylcitrate dehydratase PrpD
VFDGLGERWLVEDNAFKPYRCGIVAYPGIDAAVAMSARVGVERIAAAELRCHPLVAELMGEPDPADGLRARFSAPHGVAAGLADDAVGLRQYEDGRVRGDDLVRLRARMRLVVDEGCARDAATLMVRTVDGEELTEHVAHVRGGLARPLSDADLPCARRSAGSSSRCCRARTSRANRRR